MEKELEKKAGYDFSTMTVDEMRKLSETLDMFQKDKERKKEIVNEDIVPIEKPRIIIFTIKSIVPDDAMYEGGYIPGKTIGVFPFKNGMVLTNRNLDFNNPSLNSYITGFSEDDYLFRDDLTEEEKSDIIKEMRIAKVWLEREKGGISLDPKNVNFWRTQKFVLDNLNGMYTTANPDHLILYYNILGRGYDGISISHDKAKEDEKLLYMSVMEAEAKRSFVGTKVKITALARLEEVMDNWSIEDTLLLTYHLCKTSHGYKNSTPNVVVLEELNQFIEGLDTKNDKKKRPQEFLDAIKMFSNNPDKIKMSGLVKAAIYYGIISTDSKRNLINRETGFILGTNNPTAVEKLLDRKNIEELSNIKKRLDKRWN